METLPILPKLTTVLLMGKKETCQVLVDTLN